MCNEKNDDDEYTFLKYIRKKIVKWDKEDKDGDIQK